MEGRKIPLKEIRELVLEEQEKFMKAKDNCHINRLTDNEFKGTLRQLHEYDSSMTPGKAKELLKTFQSTRHIMCWSDGSSLANTGHLISLVHIMYDPAIHYTNQEYISKTGRDINVQEEIEKPFMYIMARCRSNDEQLAKQRPGLNV